MPETKRRCVSRTDGWSIDVNLPSQALTSQAFALSPWLTPAKIYRGLFFGNYVWKHSLHSGGHRSRRIQSRQKPLFFMSTGRDPVENQVRAELAAEGVNLDELLNGGKVVNLRRKLDELKRESETLSRSSEKYDVLQKKLDKLQKDITREKRQVMQVWLKQLFVFQALVFLVVGGLLSFDAIPGYSVPVVGQALGFWMTWLFTIPALRARKGTTKAEKSALNISFLAIPLVNVCLPAVTKNCGLIWTADVFVLAGFYTFYFARWYVSFEESGEGQPREQAAIKGVLKFLDWGSWR